MKFGDPQNRGVLCVFLPDVVLTLKNGWSLPKRGHGPIFESVVETPGIGIPSNRSRGWNRATPKTGFPSCAPGFVLPIQIPGAP